MSRVPLLLMASLWLSSPAFAEEDSYELVIKAPDKGEPSWTIGDRQLTFGPDVEIKTSAGRLMAGSCVLVEHSEGAVVKVQTSAMVHCDQTDYAAFLATYSELAQQ